MSDLDLAVSRCKHLEGLLTEYWGASGRGLHEKVSSVEGQLPREAVRQLRLVATVRNKIVHEDAYQKIDDRAGFLKACHDAEAVLQTRAPRKSRAKWVVLALFILALLILISIAATKTALLLHQH